MLKKSRSPSTEESTCGYTVLFLIVYAQIYFATIDIGKERFQPEIHSWERRIFQWFSELMVLFSDHLMLEKSSTLDKLFLLNLTVTAQSLLWPWTSWKTKTLIFCAMWNWSFGVTWGWLWRQCLFKFASEWALHLHLYECHGRTISSNQKVIPGTVRPPSAFSLILLYEAAHRCDIAKSSCYLPWLLAVNGMPFLHRDRAITL